MSESSELPVESTHRTFHVGCWGPGITRHTPDHHLKAHHPHAYAPLASYLIPSNSLIPKVS